MALTTFAPQFPAISTVTESIVALAGGGQTGATQLVSRYNSVATVATAADSVMLPPYQGDHPIYVSNDASNACAVFPYTGQQIGSAAVNASVSLTAGKTALFVGTGTVGKWRMVMSA
jgi:hypothetical protein